MFVEVTPPDWKLVIVGGDAKKQKLSNELRKLINQLGAEEQVFLEGEQKNIESYYHKSTIFAFTSSSEGFPNVIGEALSAGLPVISYDCVAGPSDMIEEGQNGFLVPLHDTTQFKKKLLLLMENENLRTQMSKIAKNSINNFSTASIAEEYYEFMNSSN
jgi:GalNAc-alpha-(1->4)-GalNAc-alpha-(1->3)-diNAcBac-PP-undecaprenol alpha-1,4-N-acetyl-D-galactosaminyltransferase